MEILKVIMCSLPIVWKSPERNFEVIEGFLKEKKSDIFLLPEMFSTGFCICSLSSVWGKETLEWMLRMADQYQSVLGGSVPVKDGDRFFNRFYFVEPSGRYSFYDKKHLFSCGGEDKIFSEGKKRIVVNYKGICFLLQICYDLRFPVFSRYRGDYDVILNVANWPESRISAWNTLLRARAIENQAYVFGVNRVGVDGNGWIYPDSSVCYFANGKEISSRLSEYLMEVDLDIQRLNEYRKKYPFLRDRDSFYFD